jgi:hypothetical protein
MFGENILERKPDPSHSTPLAASFAPAKNEHTFPSTIQSSFGIIDHVLRSSRMPNLGMAAV